MTVQAQPRHEARPRISTAPPPASVPESAPRLRAALADLAQVQARHRQAATAVRQARDALPKARAEDTQQAVLAARHGKPVPDSERLAEAERKLAAAEHELQALRGAVELVGDEVVAAARAEVDAVTAAVLDEVDSLSDQGAKLVTALGAVFEQLAERRAVRTFTTTLSQRGVASYNPSPATVAMLLEPLRTRLEQGRRQDAAAR